MSRRANNGLMHCNELLPIRSPHRLEAGVGAGRNVPISDSAYGPFLQYNRPEGDVSTVLTPRDSRWQSKMPRVLLLFIRNNKESRD
jgi:hypothetical protein